MPFQRIARYISAMISVIVPTLNAEATLTRCFAGLIEATVQGVVREVVVADGGSTDATHAIADAAGARLVRCEKGRGLQLACGAREARADWLLFLHADTVLERGWEQEALRFIEKSQAQGGGYAAAFRFGLDDISPAARWLERAVALRCAVLSLPYGDQGLLIGRRHYGALGGHKPLPLMEDVDLVRRIGRRRLRMLRSTAVTSARRYHEEGFFRRGLRNLWCIALYYLRVPPRVIVRLYE